MNGTLTCNCSVDLHPQSACWTCASYLAVFGVPTAEQKIRALEREIERLRNMALLEGKPDA